MKISDLYAKRNVTDANTTTPTNDGWKIKDPLWRQEYIRITESAAKGAITRLDNS